MSDSPAGWNRATLADVAKWGSGGTPRARDPKYYGGNIPWAVIGDLNDSLVSTTRSKVTEAAIKDSSSKIVPAGAVLIAMYGSIGKLGIAARDMATNQAIAHAIPHAVDNRYLFYYLLSQRNQLVGAGKGGTQQNISQTVLKSWPIVFPKSIQEQRLIVDILDDRISRLDAGISGLNRTGARTAALLAASTERCLQRASVYPQSTVGARAVLVQYGTSEKARSFQTDGDVPVLRMGNLQGGRVDWTRLKYLPAESAAFPKLVLRRGDLLFNRTNSAELVGKSAVVDDDRVVSFASYLIRVRFDETVVPEWAALVINSGQGRRHIQSVMTQQVGQANVNGTKLKAFPLPVPPVSEQRRLIAEHRAVASAHDVLRTEIDNAKRKAGSLRRSILTAAFSGRLNLDREEETTQS